MTKQMIPMVVDNDIFEDTVAVALSSFLSWKFADQRITAAEKAEDMLSAGNGGF